MNDPAWPPHAPDRELLVAELLERVSLVDVAALATLPAIAVLAFLWPGGPSERLVLSAADPSPLAAVATHFLHRSVPHLVSNLVAYALVVPTAYGLALVAGRRRAFFVAFALVAVVVPPTLTGLHLAALDRGIVYGFSGLAMAFAGLLPVVLGAFLEPRFDVDRAGQVAPALFFAGLGVVALLVIPPLPTRLAVAAVAGAFAAAFLRRAAGESGLPRRLPSGVHRGDVELVGVALLVFLVALLMGFAGEARTDGAVVDTFGHLLGYVVGFVIPFGVLRWGEAGALDDGRSPPHGGPPP